MRWVSVALLLLLFWVVLSFEVGAKFLIGSGIVSCVLVAWHSSRNGLIVGASMGFHLRTLPYVPWLLWQIFLANLRVIRIVWSPSLPVDPQMIEIPCGLKTSVGRAIYANSITLTPGTVTVQASGDRLLVHALTPGDAEDLKAGGMEAQVRKVEGAQ